MKKKKLIEFTSFLTLLFGILMTFVFSCLLVYGKTNLKVYEFYLTGVGSVSLILYIISKIKNLKFSIYEVIIFILMIFSCLSLINAIDINTAIFGKMNRYEGLLANLSYYALFLSATNIKSKKYLNIIIGSIILIGILNCFYGLNQVGILNLIEAKNPWTYARGLLGNSMFFGSMMCICYSLVLGIFYKLEKNKKNIIQNIIMFLLVVIFSFGVIMSGSMAVYLSSICMNLLMIYDFIRNIFKNKKFEIKKFVSIIICIIIFIMSIFLFTKQNDLIGKDLEEIKNQSQQAINGNIDDKFGTGRIYIWKKTIEKIKEAPITGFGIDNFRIAFTPLLLDPTTGRIVDKAHNDYLQRMLCEGVLSGITYIIFLIFIFFKTIRKTKSSSYYGLFLAFTCYSIQIFFSISVTRVAPIYFIIVGLLIGSIKDEKRKN